MRVLRALLCLVFATGFSFALLGKWRRGVMWEAGVIVMFVLAGLVTPHLLVVTVVLEVAGRVDAVIHAWRKDARMRVLQWAPWLFVIASAVVGVGVRAFIVEAFKTPSSAMYPTLEIGDHFFVDKLTPVFKGYRRGEVITFIYPCDPTRDYVKRIVAVGGDTVEVRCHVVYVNGQAIAAKLDDAHGTYDDYDESRDEWFVKKCSRYTETVGGRTYDIFDSPERPEQKGADNRDFPQLGMPFPPSCANAAFEGGPAPKQTLGKIVVTKPDATACEPQAHFVVPEGDLFVMGDNRSNSNDSRIWGTVPMSAVKGRVTGIWLSGHTGGRVGAVH